MSWGTGAHDFDNDGRDDIFVVHGGLIHLVPQEHSVFRNAGGVKFEDVSSGRRARSSSMKSVGRGRRLRRLRQRWQGGCFMVNLGAPAFLLHNTSPAANHWITVRLVAASATATASERRWKSWRGADPAA